MDTISAIFPQFCRFVLHDNIEIFKCWEIYKVVETSQKFYPLSISGLYKQFPRIFASTQRKVKTEGLPVFWSSWTLISLNFIKLMTSLKQVRAIHKTFNINSFNQWKMSVGAFDTTRRNLMIPLTWWDLLSTYFIQINITNRIFKLNRSASASCI